MTLNIVIVTALGESMEDSSAPEEATDVWGRSTALPLYLQISEMLMREIAAGRLLDGQRLPPERDLAKQYGTTVRTLRKALANLEDKGLLIRVQGSGNYIQSSADMDSIYAMFRLELVAGGGLPSAQFLDVKALDKPDDLPKFGSSTWATRIRRLRFLNKTPIAIEEMWLDGAAGDVDPLRLSDSLYLYYQKYLRLRITRAEDRVSVGQVPDWRPLDFDPQAGTMVGFIERFSWGASPDTEYAEAIEFSRTWFDPQRARYVQRFK